MSDGKPGEWSLLHDLPDLDKATFDVEKLYTTLSASVPAGGEVTDIVAGALYDFIGMLTSQDERVTFSASDWASPAVDNLVKFAAKRGLSLDNPAIEDWSKRLATQPPTPQDAAPAVAGYSDLINALAKCRDAFPIPEPDSLLEAVWFEAIHDPLNVPAYVKLAATAGVQPTPVVDGGDAEPIDMVLHCPNCGMQHIDKPEPGQFISGGPNAGRVRRGWNNPPHRSHLCHGCGHIWRPADVPTNGVQAVKTTGKADAAITAKDAK